VRSAEQFNAAQRLIAVGINDCAIARQIGVPRTTVRDWRRRPAIRSRELGAPCGRAHDFSTLPSEAYCYVLGLYLGDGCISRHPRSWRLRIVLDTKYPAIIGRCRAAIDMLMPGQRAAVLQLPTRCAEVSLSSKHWPCLLPQHGPGKKHTRRIALEPWQQALINRATEEFILGLIHSDGCRVVANDRGVMSVRYHFSNRSEDILGLFTAALDALEIPWTRSSKYIVSIYRKAATARLDTFVGPKDRAVPLNGVHYTA
jgi:hypothetical protein